MHDVLNELHHWTEGNDFRVMVENPLPKKSVTRQFYDYGRELRRRGPHCPCAIVRIAEATSMPSDYQAIIDIWSGSHSFSGGSVNGILSGKVLRFRIYC